MNYKKKNIIVCHGFMCNGKTTLINKLVNIYGKDNVIVLKDNSQYYAYRYKSLLSNCKKSDIQKTILLSAVNYYFTLFKTIIPSIKQDIIILDRDLYDVLTYTLLISNNDDVIEEFVYEISQVYYRLENMHNIRHVIFNDIVNFGKCVKSKKRRRALNYLRKIRNIREEQQMPLSKLLEYYNDLYVSTLLSLLTRLYKTVRLIEK